jgi:hypothetical protein
MNESREEGEPPHSAFEASRVERDRTLLAIHRLESTLGAAAGGRDWPARVGRDLAAVEEAVAAEGEEARTPDSLLSLIAAENPRRFGSRVDHLRRQFDEVAARISALRKRLEAGGSAPEAEDLRCEVNEIIRTIRHHRERESDLVYEALELDLGER